MVTRHVWQDALDDVVAFTKTSQGRRLYAWCKETIERSFAEAKENHGFRYARMLGLPNMREQSFLTAAVQNMKRLAKAFFIPFSILFIALIQTAPPLALAGGGACFGFPDFFVFGARRSCASM